MTTASRAARPIPVRRPVHLLIAASVVALSALVVPMSASAQPGPGSTIGWVRVGHLAPQVPPVDVYFARFGEPERVSIRKAGYGAVTPYSTLPPGRYTLSMRPADASPSTPAALSATISIAPGTAYSLLVFANGPEGTLNGELVTDDLTAPKTGTGRVRVVQGAVEKAPVTATVTNGPTLGTDVTYGAITPYTEVSAGRHEVSLAGGGTTTPADLDVAAGSITTLLVTQQGGGFGVTSLVDSAGPAATPILGVETGAGGAVSRISPVTAMLVIIGGSALLAAALVWRRRPNAP